jgi:hypothetical protein
MESSVVGDEMVRVRRGLVGGILDQEDAEVSFFSFYIFTARV